MIILRRTQPDRTRVFRVPLRAVVSADFDHSLRRPDDRLTVITWVRFVVWLVLGLLIYIFYSRHRSEFAKK